MKTLSSKYLFAFKLLVTGLIFTYLIYKIATALVIDDLLVLKIKAPAFLVFTLILMFFNWGLEAKKWQLLTRTFSNLTFLDSLKSVLAGLSTGLFTPNRIGNFIGRLAWVEKSKRNQATVHTLLGNLSQFLATIMGGLAGFLVFLWLYFSILNPFIVFSLILMFGSLGLFLYYKPALLLKTFIKRFLSEKTQLSITKVQALETSEKTTILLISLLRYAVFLTQYLFLFWVYEPTLSMVNLVALIATTFLLTTLIPSLFFGKLFVRESTALFVFSVSTINPALVLSVAFLLWLINLAIPSVLGGYFWVNQSRKEVLTK